MTTSHQPPLPPAEATPSDTPAAPPAERRINPFAQAAIDGMAEIAARKQRGDFVPAPEDEDPWADVPNYDED